MVSICLFSEIPSECVILKSKYLNEKVNNFFMVVVFGYGIVVIYFPFPSFPLRLH